MNDAGAPEITFIGKTFDCSFEDFLAGNFNEDPSLSPQIDNIKVHAEEYIENPQCYESSSIYLTGNINHIGLQKGMTYISKGGLNLKISDREEIDETMICLKVEET